MSIRRLHWWESDYDAQKIVNNKWQFNVAQEVAAKDGKTTSNIIWRSNGMAPMVNIEWVIDYALNWTAELPAAGVKVTMDGKWQSCDKGAVYDINERGFFVPSTEPATDGWLSVGKVNYKAEDVPGIHIVVGVKNNKTGGYDAIYIDPTELPPGSSGSYQPQEKVMWWLDGSNMSGSVYSKTSAAVSKMDYSSPAPLTNKFEWWTTYLFDSGTWLNSQTAPPLRLLQAASKEVIFLPAINLAVFGIEVKAELQNATTLTVSAFLRGYYAEVDITWLSDVQMRVTLGTRRGMTDDHPVIQMLASGSEAADIDSALDAALEKGNLPGGETWNIVGHTSLNEGNEDEDDDDEEPVTPPPPPPVPPTLVSGRKPKRNTSGVPGLSAVA